MKYRSVKFKIPPLRATVIVSFAKKSKIAVRELEHFMNIKISDSGTCAGFAIAELRKVGVWLGPECKRSQVFHESYHAMIRLMVELKCAGSDEELNAHILEFITEKILRLWEKRRR